MADVNTPDQGQDGGAPSVDVAKVRSSVAAASAKGAAAAVGKERERVREIREIFGLTRFKGEAFDALRDQCIDDGISIDQTRAALLALKQHPGAATLSQQGLPMAAIVDVADHVAQGRWAMARRQYAQAATYFRAAAAIEATIPYMEPSYWHYPVNQSLGAARLLAGDAAGASEAFRAALAQTPRNGWALYGLARSEAAAGHKAEAAAAEQAFRRAWAGDPKWLKLERL